MYMYSPNQTPRRGSVSTMSVMSDADLMQLQDGVTSNKVPYVEGNLKIVFSAECGSEVMCIRYNPDATLIAAGLADGTVKILNPDTGQALYALSDEDTRQRKLPVTSVKFKPSESIDKPEHQHVLVATYASGLIKFWHYTSNSCLSTIVDGSEVVGKKVRHTLRQTLASCFNPSGNLILTAGADPKLNIYDVETKKKIVTLEPSDSRDQMNGHRQRVFTVQYNPAEPHSFISGGWDDTVQFWDDRMKHAVRKIYGPHICGDGLDIDSTHGHILSSSWRRENVLQIWDFNKGELIKNVPQTNLHNSRLYCGQWLGKDNIVCGGCEQNMARVIDRGTLNTVGQLLDLPAAVYCLDNDRQTKPKVAIGTSTKVYVVRMEKKQ